MWTSITLFSYAGGVNSINLEPLQRMLCPHKIWDGYEVSQVLGPLMTVIILLVDRPVADLASNVMLAHLVLDRS